MEGVKRVLGVDPGFTVTGYSILSSGTQPSQSRPIPSKSIALIACGYLKFNPKNHLSLRTEKFYDTMRDFILKHQVTHIALETSFLGKNPQVFLKLGYLRGILYLLAAQHKLEISEFAPREVKSAVTGVGGSTKEQVAFMLAKMFPQLESICQTARNDVTDALAVGICGLWSAAAAENSVNVAQKSLIQKGGSAPKNHLAGRGKANIRSIASLKSWPVRLKISK